MILTLFDFIQEMFTSFQFAIIVALLSFVVFANGLSDAPNVKRAGAI